MFLSLWQVERTPILDTAKDCFCMVFTSLAIARSVKFTWIHPVQADCLTDACFWQHSRDMDQVSRWQLGSWRSARVWAKSPPTRMGFEPTRAEHNGLAVHRLNHSATLTQSYAILTKCISDESIQFWWLERGSVAQWIARRTSNGCIVDIRRLWVRVPPESMACFAKMNSTAKKNDFQKFYGFCQILWWETIKVAY